jgi:hypothetical protein
VNIVLFCSPTGFGYQYEWYKDSTILAGDTLYKLIINKPGEFYVRVTDSLGCITYTNHSIAKTYPPVIKPIILRFDPVLRLSNPYKTYQWYRNGKALVGATAPSYTMTVKGKFWCIVTDGNDCSEVSDTADTENNTSIAGRIATGNTIKLYPNPTQSKVFIESDFDIDVRVTDAVGRLIIYQKDAKMIDLEPYADAMYFFTINNKEGEVIAKEKINKISSSR